MSEMDDTSQLSRPPTTTVQQDMSHAGQRRINLIWEVTQAIIALGVIGATLVVDGYTATHGSLSNEIQSSALMQLNVMSALVTGFYFGRTNHQKQGGVGGEIQRESR